MLDCAVFLLLDCLAGALAGIGLICLCWHIRRPLRLAQHYDVHIKEPGMYSALPIYGYLRRYFLLLVLSGCVVFLVSVVGVVLAILAILDYRDYIELRPVVCRSGGTGAPVQGILTLIFAIHVATIAAFETAKRRHDGPYPITALVERVQKRLWGVAVFLLLAIGLAALLGFGQ